LFADDVFANIRKFRRNDMSVEATSIAHGQRHVIPVIPVIPVNTSAEIKKFRRNGMSVADNRKQSGNSVRNDMLITVEPTRHNQTLFSPDSENKNLSSAIETVNHFKRGKTCEAVRAGKKIIL
jgi:hypothetical protein